MVILYEILKIAFLIATILIALFFLRWNYILPSDTYIFGGKILLPFYIVLCGVMVGYIIWQVMLAKWDENVSASHIYVRAFTVGLIIGVTGALIYIFFGQ